MLPVKKILCPTDFSEPSYKALKTADELAAHFSAQLVLLHVIPPVPGQHPYPDPPVANSTDEPLYQQKLALEAEGLLEALVRERVCKEVRAAALVVTGEPADEILQVAREQEVDLIVIATHGRSGWRRLVFGSVAEQVVRLAPCPTLTLAAPHKPAE
jgi:nucleotide-binding universal stress UspA family protein